MVFPRSLSAPATLAVGLLAAACAPRVATTEWSEPAPEAFSESGERVAPTRWWTEFDDPTLDVLVEDALRSNLDLASAWQRLQQARALVERESAFLWPELDGFAEFDARRPANGDGESVTLGASAFYEVDLWGQIRSAVDAEEYRARATLADYRTVALSLSAEVTRAWFQLMEAHAQRDLIDAQIDTNAQVLDLIRARVGTGQVRGVDILRQQQLIESTRAQRIAAETRIETLEHLLAVLLGRPAQEGPGAAVPGAARLPGLPPLPDTGLPAELVRRRPDVQRAHLLLHAADADVAVAVAAQYPRLTLSASASTTDSGADELFEDWARSFAANLVGPLFDAGRRGAEVDRARALAEQRLAEYGQATLIAFQEVEDALAVERRQRERIASLEEQLRLGERTYEQLRAEYFNGLADYIDVLTTLTDLQRTRRDLLGARLTLVEARIALYRALAGGFATGREEEAEA